METTYRINVIEQATPSIVQYVELTPFVGSIGTVHSGRKRSVGSLSRSNVHGYIARGWWGRRSISRHDQASLR